MLYLLSSKMKILGEKKTLILMVGVFIFLFSFFSSSCSFAIKDMDNYEQNISNIYNKELDTTLNTDINNQKKIKDPLRQGAYHIVNSQWDKKNKLGNIINNENEITTHGRAKSETLTLIKKGVNYVLSLTSLVALIFLIYHGFLMVTAAGDDWQYKKGMKWLKTAGIALFGMWLSWFIISFIFWLIDNITNF